MKYSQIYRGIIFTNHALERMRDRGLPQEQAFDTFMNSDSYQNGKEPGTIEYVKAKDNYKTTIIAKQNEKNEWVVISAWVDPPMQGSIDIQKQENYKRYQKASFWEKVLLTIRRQLGV